MRRLVLLFVIALAAIVCSSAPAAARVSASDAAATHTYLQAMIALQRPPGVTEPANLQAIEALEAQVKTECPDVLAGAPPYAKGERTNQSESEISEELSSTVFGVSEHLQHPSDERFAKTVQHLHWSNPRLTRLLRSLALEQAEQSAIPTPDLCSDLQSWVASDYTSVSAGTKEFLHRYRVVSSIAVIESEPHEPLEDLFNINALIARRLKSYEDHADRLLAKKALPPQVNIAGLAPVLEAGDKVLIALGRTAALAP